jgi:hypothetical protein
VTRAIGWQRAEAAAVAIAAVVVLLALDFAWWWLLALFLVFDLSALGYAASPRVGARTYNAGHMWIGPAALAAFGATTDARWAMLVSLCWTFHVALDRAIGYGFKSPTAFGTTHLTPER